MSWHFCNLNVIWQRSANCSHTGVPDSRLNDRCNRRPAGWPTRATRPDRPLDAKALSDSSSSRCRHSDPVGEKNLGLTNLSGCLSNWATHTMCPLPTDDKLKSSGSLQNGKLLLRDFNWVAGAWPEWTFEAWHLIYSFTLHCRKLNTPPAKMLGPTSA